MSAQYTPMVIAAARTLSDRYAEMCMVDAEDCWKLHGEDFLADAKAALDVVGAPEMLAALLGAYEVLSVCYPLHSADESNKSFAMAKMRAAIVKATGEKA